MIKSQTPETVVPRRNRPGGSSPGLTRTGTVTSPARATGVRVAVADCRPLIADALAALFDARPEFTVTGVIDSGAAAAEIAAQDPDVVLVGIAADRRPGMELACALRAQLPSVKIVLVAEILEPELVNYVLDHALGGLLLTDSPAGDLAVCLDHVAHGRAVLPPGWQKALAAGRNNPVDLLSSRQLQVLKLLADGYSYEEIGARLFISLNTVKFHVRSIFLRLGVRNRMAAARLLSNR